MKERRPFRFGLQSARADSSIAWRELAIRSEAMGFDIMLIPDHIGGRFAYGPALMSAADAAPTLKVGPLVLDNDFRHPAITASEAVTLNVLTDGRFEFGLGAGWMLEDYEKSGIPFDTAKASVGSYKLLEMLMDYKTELGDDEPEVIVEDLPEKESVLNQK